MLSPVQVNQCRRLALHARRRISHLFPPPRDLAEKGLYRRIVRVPGENDFRVLPDREIHANRDCDRKSFSATGITLHEAFANDWISDRSDDFELAIVENQIPAFVSLQAIGIGQDFIGPEHFSPLQLDEGDRISCPGVHVG